MTLLFGVDSHNFRLMWVLALVVSLLQLYPLFFLWLLPKGNTTDLDVSDTSAAYEDVIGKENKKD